MGDGRQEGLQLWDGAGRRRGPEPQAGELERRYSGNNSPLSSSSWRESAWGRWSATAAEGPRVGLEVVKVLLGGHEAGGTGDDLGVVAEPGHDVVGESELRDMLAVVLLRRGLIASRSCTHLVAGAGTTEKDTGCR